MNSDRAGTPRRRSDDLAEAFFEDARAVMLGEESRIYFDSPTFLSLIRDQKARLRFKNLVESQCQNDELRSVVLAFLEDIQDELIEQSDAHENAAKQMEFAVGGAGMATAGAGIAGIIATGGTLALFAIFAGVAGVAGGGMAAGFERDRANKKRADVRKMERLINEIKSGKKGHV